MLKGIKLILVYSIYLVLVIAVVFLLLPSEGRQLIKDKFSNIHLYKYFSEVMNINGYKTGNEDKESTKYVILSFDDGWSSQYDAFKMIKPLKGTLYITSSLIGKEGRLSLDNLTEMYNAGWDICNHTVHHVNLTEVSHEKAYEEIYGCSAWISGHGFTRSVSYKHFAYPEGGYNDDIIGILKEQGFLTARTTKAGNDTSSMLEIGRTSLHGMTKENIRDKILSEDKILILSFHRIVPDSTTEMKEIDLKESYFKEVLDAINESKRKVLTITEWYEMNK